MSLKYVIIFHAYHAKDISTNRSTHHSAVYNQCSLLPVAPKLSTDRNSRKLINSVLLCIRSLYTALLSSVSTCVCVCNVCICASAWERTYMCIYIYIYIICCISHVVFTSCHTMFCT